MVDKDGGPYLHWLVFDIPGKRRKGGISDQSHFVFRPRFEFGFWQGTPGL